MNRDIETIYITGNNKKCLYDNKKASNYNLHHDLCKIILCKNSDI